MNRRGFIQLAGAGLLAGCGARMPWRGRPNLILIMADDLGYGDLGFTGRRDYATPAIDRIAREGVTLTQAYAAAPVCTPTRVALHTGRYPARYPVGLLEPLTKQSDIGLPTAPPTLAQQLKQVGYKTALVGKWHLGIAPQFHPTRHGYDEFYGMLGAAADYQSHIDTETLEHLFQDGTTPVKADGQYLTELFTERAASIIAREHDAPFFLNLQYNAPHWPWQAPGDPVYPDSLRWAKGGSPDVYARMMQSLDQGVSKVLDALDRAGLEKQTLVVFTSDNGGERYSHMGPFSGAKMTLQEGGLRVPAAARWPGVIPVGSTMDQVAITMDWTATLLALAGTRAPREALLDGIDLLPALTGMAGQHERALFWRIHQRQQQKAARIGDWKYLQTAAGEFLYNLADDPGEARDRKESERARFAQLRERLAAWEKEMLPPVPLDPKFV